MTKHSTAPRADPNPAYWDNYNNLQHVKHEVIRNYLNGWFPKLGSWHGRIVYFDTHAGRGRHTAGQYGSPLVALTTLLEHRYRDTLLANCEVRFQFCEEDEQNVASLQTELTALGTLPRNVVVEVTCGNCFAQLDAILTALSENNDTMAPAFIFVDPYGFKVPGQILKRLMTFKRVELFVNVIWRELNMAISQVDERPGFRQTLDSIFDGSNWRDLIPLDTEARSRAALALYRTMVNARWATPLYMEAHNTTRYILLHLTDHDDGRDLMKDCIWKVCPDGGFHASATDRPLEEYIIQPEPDLRPLRQWILNQLARGPRPWALLNEAVRPEIWRKTHVNDMVRELHQEGIVEGRDFAGRFAEKNNPTLYLTTGPPGV